MWFQCISRTCSFITKNRDAYVRHRELHHEDNVEVCNSCSALFPTNSDGEMAHHLAMEHNICARRCLYFPCAYESSVTDKLNYHMKTAHVQHWKCDICNEAFISNTDKIFHRESHRREYPGPCTDSFCCCTMTDDVIFYRVHRYLCQKEKPKCATCGQMQSTAIAYLHHIIAQECVLAGHVKFKE